MKHIAIAGLIVLSTGAASGAPFGFQQQVGSSELDLSIWEGAAVATAPFTAGNLAPSEFVLFPGVDIEGSADVAYVGQMMPSVDSGISSYEQVMN